MTKYCVTKNRNLFWEGLKTLWEKGENGKHLHMTKYCITKNQNLFWEGLKTLWEKEKMLVTSIFSFSQNVFKRLFLQDS